MLADLKQFWRFAGAAEAENKEHQIAGEDWKTGSKKKKGCSSWKEGCIGLYIKGSLCLWCHMIYIERETSKFTVVEVYCWCCIFPYLLLFSL